MDSGNSGSMQSSSGGDEEYDSRTDSLSAFLNSSSHVGPISNQQPPPFPLHHHHQNHQNQSHPSTTLFDPLSNYLDPFSQPTPPPNQNSFLNHNIIWPRTLRSDPNCTDISALMASSSSSSTTSQSIPSSQDSIRIPLIPNPSSVRPSQLPSDHHQTHVVRNSKKRSRASRRAPTTVLTTDTSNFRAMVQEFTGIPAPPFSASPFPRSRFDLFNTASTTMRSGHLEAAPPSFLLRPFAQKVHVHQPPTFGSSSSFSSSTAINTTNTTTASNNLTSSTNNYQLLSELGLPKQSQNLLNIQNPILSFQSLLQSHPPPPTTTSTTTATATATAGYPLANVTIFNNSKSQGSSATDSQLKIGLLDEFDMNHHGNVRAHLGGLDRLNDNSSSSWADGVVGSNDGDRIQLRSFNGNSDNSQRVNSCKMNYTGPSSDFSAEKGSENVSSRGEGMVDSWICSSD